MQSILSLSLILLCAGFTSSANVSKRPNGIDLEVVTVSRNSVQATFRPYKEVKVYYVDITLKNAGEYGMMSQYHTTLTRNELQDDGLYHIDSGNTLLPGLMYEIEVSNDRRRFVYGKTSFWTDCDKYSFRCGLITSEFSKACVPSEKLCDNFDDCDDRSDEAFNPDDGTCANTRPRKPGSVGMLPDDNTYNSWFDSLDDVFDWFG